MERHEDTFHHFGLCGLHNPFLLKGMNEALKRIVKAVNEREKIVIYGYNNVDGVTGIALFMLVLKYLNADVEYYIPDGIDNGFELQEKAINNHIRFLGAKLVITVGCGINSVNQVELCKALGIDVIITDYHECHEELPDTVVVNPKQRDCFYPFKDLFGVGVAFKVVQAVAMYYQMKCISKYLDLVMIGTISHETPLVGENKVMVDEGLYHLTYTNNYGLIAYMNINKVTKFDYKEMQDAFKNLVPLGANPRNTDNAKIAVELLTTNNVDRAEQIAKYLKNECSTKRLDVV